MTELERWMNDHPPLADALTAEETAALRAKVLARRPRVHVLRGWRLAAAAAALCLVAAGAVVLGLFHPMSAANETNALVQKYGEVLDEPLTAEINGHTVSVKALLRRGETLPLDERDDAELAVALESELETRELMAQVMALPPPDGELFLRRYVYGETAAQLGVHFNMPAATVRTRLHRARLALQKLLKEG